MRALEHLPSPQRGLEDFPCWWAKHRADRPVDSPSLDGVSREWFSRESEGTYEREGAGHRKDVWKPGDPCGACGSRNTHGPIPGCRDCGASDADE